ncbi:hypothetical protein AVEN_88307-1 [Araneus ventricosus]|uniref:Uncharacterized protein n=1 Tax=Araneus ventricosus TaxID=182803 RepID=A0A4Y2R6C9_ARAVE|nr:hypothetical protein AVEN_88307-1 [Araneus ventricosus]
MPQFASSDSSAESEIAKAESMSRGNHLHDEMNWRAVGMLQPGARLSTVARELNVHRSVIHRLWNHYQKDQNASRRRETGLQRITTTADGDSWRRSSLLLQEGPYPAILCRVDCMKEYCSHDGLLFVCLCPHRTLERGCIGPVNIAV